MDKDFAKFLPPYLSQNDQFLRELKNFTVGGIPRSLYSLEISGADFIMQGDGIREVPLVRLPQERVGLGNCIVFSNTCDISLENQRVLPNPMVVYAPILNLRRYQKQLLDDGKNELQVDSHIESIRKQVVTQVFYLPEVNGLDGEGMVILDHVCSCSLGHLNEIVPAKRIFALSDFGHYLFLFKLSYHFNRLTTDLARGRSELIN